MFCTRQLQLSSKIEVKQNQLLDYPILNKSLEWMSVNNRNKRAQLGNVRPSGTEWKKRIKPERLDKMLNSWQKLLKDRSEQGVAKFVEKYGFESNSSIVVTDNLLILLTLISNQPELIDKEMIQNVISESFMGSASFTDNMIEDEKSLSIVRDNFKRIEELGFNMVGLRLNIVPYPDIVMIMGAEYIINNQFYPIMTELIINNSRDIPESKKLYKKYVVDDDSKIRTLTYLRLLSNDIDIALLPVNEYTEYMTSMRTEIGKLINPSRMSMISLINSVINSRKSNVSLESSQIKHSDVPNIFDEYRNGKLLDFKLRHNIAKKYFRDNNFDIKIIYKYASNQFLDAYNFSKIKEFVETKFGRIYFNDVLHLGVTLTSLYLGFETKNDVTDAIITKFPFVIDSKIINNYGDTIDRYTLLERLAYLFFLLGNDEDNEDLVLFLHRFFDLYFRNGFLKHNILSNKSDNIYREYYPFNNEGKYSETLLDIARDYLGQESVIQLLNDRDLTNIEFSNSLLPNFVMEQWKYIGLMITVGLNNKEFKVPSKNIIRTFTNLIALELTMKSDMTSNHLDMLKNILSSLTQKFNLIS